MGPRQYGRRESDRRVLKPGGRAVAADGHGARLPRFVAWQPLDLNQPRVGGPCSLDRVVTGILEGEIPDWFACVVGAGRTDRGGQAFGCWNWSAATIARRTLPAHRPGRLPGAFVACATGNLVLEGASRLDAFSAYPFPTWLPGDAPSGTAGTPEVGPPQSSRTRGDAPQVSYAHGR